MNIYNVINKLNAMQNRLRLLRVIFQVLVVSFVIIEVVTGFSPMTKFQILQLLSFGFLY